MKFVKSVSSFFVLPFILFLAGLFIGSKFQDFFYPGGSEKVIQDAKIEEQKKTDVENMVESNMSSEAGWGKTDSSIPIVKEAKSEGPVKEQAASQSVSTFGSQLIDSDTQFLVEEVDLSNSNSVETTWQLPEKYIGMDREEFIHAMEEYELSPPLSELERGFVSLEIKSFSTDKVCVQMNYVYTKPSTSFYLMAEDNYLVVYCEDQKTLYMQTNILLESLPDDLQQQIINVMFVEDEKTLYNFLESYSS